MEDKTELGKQRVNRSEEEPVSTAPPPMVPPKINPALPDPEEMVEAKVLATIKEGMVELQRVVTEFVSPVPRNMGPRMMEAVRGVKEQTRTELARIHGSVETYIVAARQARKITYEQYADATLELQRLLQPAMPPQQGQGGPNAPMAAPTAPNGTPQPGDAGEPPGGAG